MRRIIFLLVVGLIIPSQLTAAVFSLAATSPALPAPPAPKSDLKEYQEFFEEVYQTMDKNYYYPITRQAFAKFLYVFDKKIYGQLRRTGKTDKYIKWRSAAHLVDALKAPEDVFSAFIPPKPAKEFEQTALGKKQDLGIEGRLIKEGFEISAIEPRSDAFAKGLREKDIIKEIDQVVVSTLTEEKILALLVPTEGTVVNIKYYDALNKAEKAIDIGSKEYFKQTVFMVPVDVPGVFCLQIKRFNQGTAEDMTKFMGQIMKQGDTSLIIDLRGNPGGPPLAAREISAFFLPPEEEFAYFQMKNKPKAELFVPNIPEQYHYKGDIVILVNKESGSASELFSGILQSRGRAMLMGTNTAGQVFLKSMFHFEDESMLLLVTARGHFSDGKVFSFNGLDPDAKVTEDATTDLIKYAADYLTSQKNKK